MTEEEFNKLPRIDKLREQRRHLTTPDEHYMGCGHSTFCPRHPEDEDVWWLLDEIANLTGLVEILKNRLVDNEKTIGFLRDNKDMWMAQARDHQKAIELHNAHLKILAYELGSVSLEKEQLKANCSGLSDTYGIAEQRVSALENALKRIAEHPEWGAKLASIAKAALIVKSPPDI